MWVTPYQHRLQYFRLTFSSSASILYLHDRSCTLVVEFEMRVAAVSFSLSSSSSLTLCPRVLLTALLFLSRLASFFFCTALDIFKGFGVQNPLDLRELSMFRVSGFLEGPMFAAIEWTLST